METNWELEKRLTAAEARIREHEALIDHVLERSLFAVLAALPRSLLPLAEASRRRVIDKTTQCDAAAKPE
jgi:hypothetical protein